MSTAVASDDRDPDDTLGLEHLVRGPVAAAVLRSLMRDQMRQMKENGAGVQSWALPVFQALQDASGVEVDSGVLMSVTGRGVGRVSTTNWVGVGEAAARTRRSDRQIRRLAASGQVIARRLGNRSWLIDIDSLENVLRSRAA